MENEVSIIRAKTSLEDRRMRGKEIVRKRVAAYCRVSTDGEEQLNSFSSQVKYYTELDNLGESDKYLLKDHHEAIVSREVFDKAQEILAKRGKCRSNARLRKDEYRTLYTNKYAFRL